MKNTNAQVLLFFLQNSRYISNEKPCLRTPELYDDLFSLVCFIYFYFIFSVPISFSVCFPISPSLFSDVPSQAFIKHSIKALYTYINMHYIYFRKLMNFCLTKTFMTF